MTAPHVAVLGAGPAGLGAAYRLRREDRARVTVLEQHPVPGGNAGSFEVAGLQVDFGSHRLHPSCAPEIMADIRRFLGPDLLDRPRHGRIALRGRWIHFPLKPVDLLLGLDRGFAARSIRDMVTKPLRKDPAADTFAEVLRASLGPTICDEFYFPYAVKIWGRPPEELSGTQARRRVSASSAGKLIRKVLSQVPGLKPPGAGRFFYPKRGFGQISEAYAREAAALGADLRYRTRVVGLKSLESAGKRTWEIETERDGVRERIEADHVWSTLPLTIVTRLIGDAAPAEVHRAAATTAYRGMILIYLELPVPQFTEFDAHYFPSADVRITRLSEPKNYSLATEVPDRTVLCAELPASPEDAIWRASDAELGRLVADDLARSGIPIPAAPISVSSRRLPQAYPIYRVGYEESLETIERWIEGLPNFLSYGRQGLFAHDNTHHALAMAYGAVDSFGPAGLDPERWAAYRRVFETHVVED
jgi:protoporphyrinogen oxidase